MASGEVFPNAPLQFVACEITYPPAEEDAPGLLEAVHRALNDSHASITFAPPGLVRAVEDGDPEAAMFRLVAFDATVSVTVWRRALVIEHSDYAHWAEFAALAGTLIDALFVAAPPAGVTRIGLRYVDEVHLPGPAESLLDWAPYLHPALLWPTQFVESPVLGAAGGFGFSVGPHRAVNVRTAMLPTRALTTSGPFRLRDRPETPAFLFDCDGYYQPAELDASLGADGILGVCDELHTALDALFQSAFTDAARDVFRGKEES